MKKNLMKKNLMRSFLFLLASMMISAGNAAQADYALTILHTNDVHARFEPINQYDNACSVDNNAAGKCFGGSARLATAVKAARARATTRPRRCGPSARRWTYGSSRTTRAE